MQVPKGWGSLTSMTLLATALTASPHLLQLFLAAGPHFLASLNSGDFHCSFCFALTVHTMCPQGPPTGCWSCHTLPALLGSPLRSWWKPSRPHKTCIPHASQTSTPWTTPSSLLAQAVAEPLRPTLSAWLAEYGKQIQGRNFLGGLIRILFPKQTLPHELSLVYT